jgi:hypothetical protein
MENNMLKIALNEYERLRSETYSVESRHDRVATISLSIIIFIIAYGIKEHISEIFLVSPIIVYSVVFYLLQSLYSIMVRHGYMNFLEEKINKFTGKNILQWESVHSKNFLHFPNSPTSLGIRLMAIFLALIIIIYSYYRIFIHYPKILFFLHLGISILLIIWIIWSFYKTLTVAKSSYKLSTNYFVEHIDNKIHDV